MSPFGLYHTTPFRYFFFFACKRQCFNGCLKTPVGNAGCLGTKECIRFYLLQRNHAIPLFLFFNPSKTNRNLKLNQKISARQAQPGISADVKRALGVLATMTPPGPTFRSDYGRSVRPPRPLSLCDPHAYAVSVASTGARLALTCNL